ncbi:MAG: aspartate/glutamate racemase family protein [Arenicellales bacterium]|jgi:Asp/Glu/hydantoin racemase|nr:aspartate/glutamate racemase family protein [Arenicellales bacterium]MEC8962843.1 aspartate/glutamate racemase family protein [Pseudomonadota bacterium]MED5391531.1 aspartate/glutamate racemase family protein [Pseudomonadota bacterium]MEE3280377.1 aspartate/glutamate racemase family protein [Pseudomonadota bacterium]
MEETSNPVRITVINPNSSDTVTQSIDKALDPLRWTGGPVIDCLTLREGPPGIETQCHVDGVISPLSDLIRAEDATTSAFVIACFSDPGLHSAREITSSAVFGIAESAYSMALNLGEKFGVIAILPGSVIRQQRYIRQIGLSQRYAASLALNTGVSGLEGDSAGDQLVAAGRVLIDTHGADVLILGCAGMARFRERIATELNVPVIDPCQAATIQAVASVLLAVSA